MTTALPDPRKCLHCGGYHETTCPRIKSIEYDASGYIIRRVEFHDPAREEIARASAGGGDEQNPAEAAYEIDRVMGLEDFWRGSAHATACKRDEANEALRDAQARIAELEKERDALKARWEALVTWAHAKQVAEANALDIIGDPRVGGGDG